MVQEDREGSTFGATIADRNFLNGARHSVYYKRDFNETELMIDRQQVEIVEMQEQILTNLPELGANEVQIGGLNTTDPRFAIYKGYNGCLSSKIFSFITLQKSENLIIIFLDIFIEINNQSMKPLEEYMLFTKTAAEKVHVSNAHGVRSAQCADHFDIIHKLSSGPTLNISQVGF